MKKIILSSTIILLFIFYIFYQKNSSAQVAQVPTVIVPTPTPAASSTPMVTQAPAVRGSVTPTSVLQPIPTPTPTPRRQYADGTYTGSSADAFYGNVQVRAVIQNGKLTDVQFLDYPRDRGESLEINSQATPALAQEAIKAQSANVDIVSGATQTSQAFRQSLASALNQAKA